MKVIGITACALSLFLYTVVPCYSDCPTLQEYLNKDDQYRLQAALHFGLPHDTSWEIQRPVIARYYKLSSNASWAEIREKRFQLQELDRDVDDRDRQEWARGVCLPNMASWSEIGKRLDQKRAAENK